jgi:hypothetical protein
VADFGDALKAMKAGKRVRRAVWESGRESWQGAYMSVRDLGQPYEPQIIFAYEDKGRPPRPFSGGQWDLLADDWEILED